MGTYLVAMVVASYRAGLGIGSFAGGLLSRRLSRRAALVAFAGAEFSVGLFAAPSGRLYYDVLSLHGAWSSSSIG